MTSSILVTGGTGTLGRLVVPLLREADCKIRILSRHGHPAEDDLEFVTGDLLKDEGIEAAVDGAETIVHLAGGPKGDEIATANLMRVAARAGVRHVVLISVGLMSLCIAPASIPLLIHWLKPETKARFGVVT